MDCWVGSYGLARVVEVWRLIAMPNFVFFCFVVLAFWDGVLCSQGWPRAHYIDEHGFKLMIFLFPPPQCWGYRSVHSHTLLNRSFRLWDLNAISLMISQKPHFRTMSPLIHPGFPCWTLRWLSHPLTFFFLTHFCVVLKVLSWKTKSIIVGSKEKSAMHVNKCHFNKRWILMNRTRKLASVLGSQGKWPFPAKELQRDSQGI